MKYFLLLSLLLGFSSCAPVCDKENKIIIAHAGGGIGKKHYINSKEAVEQSIQRGFGYIELDLLETTDGDLVAAHDWKTFHTLTGYPSQTDSISAQEAQKRKILGEQTVLTSKEIKEIFTQHTDLYLVTDKIRNVSLLLEKFADFSNRIIVELKFIEECNPENLATIYKCAFLFDKTSITDNTKPLLVTIPLRDIEGNKKWFKKHPNVKALVYTVNDLPTAKKILSYPFVKGIYSDFLYPQLLQEVK